MADDDHVSQLLLGARNWNLWRENHPGIRPDLVAAQLGDKDLSRRNLKGAFLMRADLSGANLTDADLSGASLGSCNFTGATLKGAQFARAYMNETVFGNVDLSTACGLDRCVHAGPSVVDLRTLQHCGQLPLRFLRGVGLPESFIEYLPAFLRHPIQFFSCFISYSAVDDPFVKRLHADLQDKGVRCWFAPEDIKVGDKLWDTIDQAIRVREKVLLVLSKHSIASDWVEDEVAMAFAEERQRKKLVLFPVRLDDAVMETSEAWAVKLREQRHIGDFRSWKRHDQYSLSLARILRDLEIPSPEANACISGFPPSRE